MNRDHSSRRRRIGVAALVGLAAMLVGLVVAPSVGQAASSGTAVAETTGREVLTVDDPAPTLTLRELKQMAERAAGTSVPARQLSVVVDGGRTFPSLLLVSLVDGPSLDLTLREVTGGQHDGEAKEIKVIVIINCNGCTF